MSIASEITRLQNAKASIKTSIENKGVTVPSTTKLDGYATLIDSIPSGMTIKNGTIVNYKASTTEVEAGTFVRRVTRYDGLSISQGATNTYTYVSDGVNLGNYYVLFNQILNYDTAVSSAKLAVYECSGSGLVSRTTKNINSDVLGLVGYPQGIYMFKIDSTHFAVCNLINGQTGAGSSKIVINIYSYISNSLTLVSQNYYAYSDISAGSTGTSIYSAIHSEDNDYAYYHVSATFTGGTTVRSMYTIKVSKTDYTISFNTISTSHGYGYYDLYELENNKFLGHNGTRFCVIEFNPSTQTYSYTATTLSNYGGSGNSNSCYFYLDNELIMITRNSDTTLTYCKITIASDNSLSISSPQTLIDKTGDTNFTKPFGIWILNQTKIDSKTCLITTASLYSGYAIYGVNGLIVQNNGGTITHGTLTELSDAPSSVSTGIIFHKQSDICNNAILSYAGMKNATSSPTNLYIYNLSIDNNLDISKSTSSHSTVAPATSTINGLTKTNCTDTSAGEVYILGF